MALLVYLENDQLVKSIFSSLCQTSLMHSYHRCRAPSLTPKGIASASRFLSKTAHDYRRLMRTAASRHNAAARH